jgi:hypothetical protein
MGCEASGIEATRDEYSPNKGNHMFERAHPSRTFGRGNADLADNRIGLLIEETGVAKDASARQVLQLRAASD